MSKRQQVRRVHSEVHTIEDVNYEVTVEQDRDGLWGKWFCQTCGLPGATSIPEQSISRAVLGAKMNLGTHHGHVHRKKS